MCIMNAYLHILIDIMYFNYIYVCIFPITKGQEIQIGGSH